MLKIIKILGQKALIDTNLQPSNPLGMSHHNKKDGNLDSIIFLRHCTKLQYNYMPVLVFFFSPLDK